MYNGGMRWIRAQNGTYVNPLRMAEAFIVESDDGYGIYLSDSLLSLENVVVPVEDLRGMGISATVVRVTPRYPSYVKAEKILKRVIRRMR